MVKEASLPVRLNSDMKARLQKAADAMGMTVSSLIRLLVKSFLDEYEANDGRILMPPQWKHAPFPQTADRKDLPKAAESRDDYPNDPPTTEP